MWLFNFKSLQMRGLLLLIFVLGICKIYSQSNQSIRHWSFSTAYSPNITGSLRIPDQHTPIGQNLFMQAEKNLSKSWGIFANVGFMSTQFVYYNSSSSGSPNDVEQHLHFHYLATFIGPSYHVRSFYIATGFGLAFLKEVIFSHYTLNEFMMRTSDCIQDSREKGRSSANIGNMLTLGHTMKCKSFMIDVGIRGYLIYDTSIYDTYGLGIFLGLKI